MFFAFCKTKRLTRLILSLSLYPVDGPIQKLDLTTENVMHGNASGNSNNNNNNNNRYFNYPKVR